MRALGIVRRIDNLGRVVIPMEIRKTNGWDEQTPMEMFSTEDGLLIRKYADIKEKANVVSKLVEVLGYSIDPKIIKAVEDAIDFIEEN